MDKIDAIVLGGLANLLIIFILSWLVNKINKLSCKLDGLVDDKTCLERRGVFSQRVIDCKKNITQLFDRTDKSDVDMAFLKGQQARQNPCGDDSKTG